jgi:hypothetical protein
MEATMATSKAVIPFKDDDKKYQAWAEAHPDGFVINTDRRINRKYLSLHKASCRRIRDCNRMARPGGYTERAYIKICSGDLEALRQWAQEHGSPKEGFTQGCKICHP